LFANVLKVTARVLGFDFDLDLGGCVLGLVIEHLAVDNVGKLILWYLDYLFFWKLDTFTSC